MEELRIPKIRVPIICHTTQQEKISGDVFFDMISSAGYTTGQALDFFNSPLLFFPLKVPESQASILMQKGSLIRVDFPDLMHEYETEVSSTYDLRKDAIVHFRTIGSIHMQIIIDAPFSRARIQDMLNGQRAFIPALLENTFVLIHRRHIYKVEEL